MVTFTRLTNQRLKTNRHEHLQTRKKVWLPSRCHHTASSCDSLVFFFSPFFSSLFPFSLFISFFSFLHVPVAISLSPYGSCLLYIYIYIYIYIYMDSDHVRVAPERSRSPDEPMWQNRNHQRRRQYRDTWHDVPPVRRPRQVLIIVNLEAVRPLMTRVHGDVMDSTTCESLPSLGRMEELALFTYHVLIHTYHVDTHSR